MGKERKEGRDPIEDVLDVTETAADQAPGEGEGGSGERQTVVDDQYLAELRSRLESPTDAGEPITARTARPGPPPDTPLFQDPTTEKLESEQLGKSASRAMKDSYPPPVAPTAESIYILCGPDAGRTFPLTSPLVRIGRGQDNDIVLQDGSISRQHLVLMKGEEGWTFEDLESENGTYLEGEYSRGGAIAFAQPIELGRTIFVIEQGPRKGG